MIVLIDHRDSFVHNLARYFRGLGAETVVLRSDEATVQNVLDLAPSHLVLSPGPCSPAEARLSCQLVHRMAAAVPILGVCLGHQCIAAAFGGRIVPARNPRHGCAVPVRHRGGDLFQGIPSPFRAGLYHSLAVARDDLPACLDVTAVAADGEIMAIRHVERPIHGVQFHPESVLTPHGHRLLASFLGLAEVPAVPAPLPDVSTPAAPLQACARDPATGGPGALYHLHRHASPPASADASGS